MQQCLPPNCGAYVEFLQCQTIPTEWARARGTSDYCIMCNLPAVHTVSEQDTATQVVSSQGKLCGFHVLDAVGAMRSPSAPTPQEHFAFSLRLRARRGEQGRQEQAKRKGKQPEAKNFLRAFKQAPKKLTASEKRKRDASLEAKKKEEERSSRWERGEKLEEEAEAAKELITREEEARKRARHKQLSKIDKNLKNRDLLEESRVWQSYTHGTQTPYLSEEKYQFLSRITSADNSTTVGRNEFCKHLNDLCASDLLPTFELIAYREWDQYKHKINDFEA